MKIGEWILAFVMFMGPMIASTCIINLCVQGREIQNQIVLERDVIWLPKLKDFEDHMKRQDFEFSNVLEGQAKIIKQQDEIIAAVAKNRLGNLMSQKKAPSSFSDRFYGDLYTRER